MSLSLVLLVAALVAAQTGPQEGLKTVADTRMSLDLRRQAARGLIESGQPAAISGLVALLMPQGEPSTHRVIAQALSSLPEYPPEPFSQPLLQLLASAKSSLVAEIGTALGRYSNPRLSCRLTEVALDTKATVDFRTGVIRSLAAHRTQKVAQVLLRLIEADQPKTIRDEAFNALTNLTGITRFGRDRTAWLGWWERHRKIPRKKWLTKLANNFARRSKESAAQRDAARDRLVEIQRKLYRTMSPQQKPTMLVALLNDPLVPSRLLGIELTVLRLSDELPIMPELRQALLARLNDPSPVIRERVVTRLLRILADQAAANAIARRLTEQSESNNDVIRAYLLMMAALPRKLAVQATIGYLNDPPLRNEAAGALAEMAKLNLLDNDQVAQVSHDVHKLLRGRREPTPEMVALLGEIAAIDTDWKMIIGWLAHPDNEVKIATARVLATSDRPLAEFHPHLADPMILPIFIRSVAQRGKDELSFMTLIRHKPQQPNHVESWQRALVEVSARVPPTAIVMGDMVLSRMKEPTTLRQQVLSVAISRLLRKSEHENEARELTVTEIAVLLELLVLRAGVRMAEADSADPRAALEDYERIADLTGGNPTPSQNGRIGLGTTAALLRLGQADQALRKSHSLLRDQVHVEHRTALAEQLLDLFLATVEKDAGSAEPDRRQRAAQIVVALRPIFEAFVPQTKLVKLLKLEAQFGQHEVSPNPPQSASTEGPADAPPESEPRAKAESPKPESAPGNQ